MRHLKLFEDIKWEVEHPLYLAHILTFKTGETAKILLNEFERATVPVLGVAVHYIPRFDKVSMTGGQITTKDQAYRVLYQTNVIVGTSHIPEEINAFIERAETLAKLNPDPTRWKEAFTEQ